MAGHPIQNKMIAELRRRTAARFPDDLGANELDYLADWLANGETLAKLSRELDVSPQLVMSYMRNKCGADVVRDTLRTARETGAHILAEQTIDIADAATPETAHVARLRTSARQWVAERWNMREFASKGAQVALQVNVGALMLDALRQPIAELRAIVPAIPSDARTLTDGRASD